MRALRLDDVPCEPQRIARLDRHVQRAGIEPARPEDVVDRAREPVGLAGDDVEQLRALVVVEHDVAPPQRHRRAVDRGERRAQLVRDRRDELRAHRLERALLGQVAEGVDDAVRHGDAVIESQSSRVAEVERQRLRPRSRDTASSATGTRAAMFAQPGIASTAGRSSTSTGRRPVRPRPPGSSADEPAAVDEEDAVADRGEHARGLRALLGLAVERRVVDRDRGAPAEVERELEIRGVYFSERSAQAQVMAPIVRPRATSGTARRECTPLSVGRQPGSQLGACPSRSPYARHR